MEKLDEVDFHWEILERGEHSVPNYADDENGDLILKRKRGIAKEYLHDIDQRLMSGEKPKTIFKDLRRLNGKAQNLPFILVIQ